MPQYKKTQYGLKQYGLFLPARPGGETTRWTFLRSRIGIKQHGRVFYIYQHTPRVVMGNPKRMRLSSNTGETLYKDERTLTGHVRRLRMRENTSAITIQSQNVTQGGSDT